LKDAMEGTTAPENEREVPALLRSENFFQKILKVVPLYCGKWMVKSREMPKIRIIREGVVNHEGELIALRLKDDVGEAASRYGLWYAGQIKGIMISKKRDVIESKS
jgi:translation initiation factor IF-2